MAHGCGRLVDDAGVPCFDQLRSAKPALLYAFDLIEIDGVDIRRNPIEERKRALAKLLRGATCPGVRHKHLNPNLHEYNLSH